MKPKVKIGRDCFGSMQILLILIVFFFTFSGMGVWGFLRHWRFLVETQLRLDQCVGKASLEFRDTLNSIEASNRKIQKLRVAIQIAKLEPKLIPPLQAALAGVVISQEAIRAQWKWKRLKGLLGWSCSKKGDLATPLPGLEYVRDPPDSLGPQVLHWPGKMPESFFFCMMRSPRTSSALVQGGAIEAEVSSSRWRASWCSPKQKWANIN